jgi:adenylate kinase
MNHYDAVFLMGPQGSGKGTQAKILTEKLGFFYWEMGGILRGMKEYRLPDGETVGSIVDKGIYLSDEQILEIVKAKLPQIPAEQGIIFDGIPRRLGQAEFLINWLHDHKRQSLATIFLSLPREKSLERLRRRAEIEKRVDDTPQAIELRLRQYEETTLPILDYMREHTRFIELDGRPPIPEVTQELFKVLELSN